MLVLIKNKIYRQTLIPLTLMEAQLYLKIDFIKVQQCLL